MGMRTGVVPETLEPPITLEPERQPTRDVDFLDRLERAEQRDSEPNSFHLDHRQQRPASTRPPHGNHATTRIR